MEDLSGLCRVVMGNRILDDEVTQVRELLGDIAIAGSRTFMLWFQGVESYEMAQREKILNSLSNAGLVVLEWKVTNHNAYIKTRLTEKGTKFLHKIAGLKAIIPNV